MNANTNTTIADLTKLTGRVYVFVPNSKIERRFLSDAEKEGFLFENGDRPTEDMGNSIYQLMSDHTIGHVTFAGRINNGERYAAIILGACPHKVAGLGDWTSFIEKCKQSEGMPRAYDARSRSGELKVTKESFKAALRDVCNELRLKNAC